MHAIDIIVKKRDGLELTREEIEFFVEGMTKGDIPDYQVAAWAMAVLLRGMTPRETTDLTLAMAYSGKVLDLSKVISPVVDKHSTGGVGDKTSLVVVPLVRACGLPVGKLSGRGLGYSGGTIDKLETIPGFRADLTTEEFINQLRVHGIALSGQSIDLAPADGKLYALRDVTGTIQSIPLIASSIMSKKIAAGAEAIVLDVKVGLGAFMKTLKEARELASLMVDIAKLSGRRAVAVISDMNQPLGCAVGNALELKEAIETLQGGGPPDFVEHCSIVAAQMLLLGGCVSSVQEGRTKIGQSLTDGSALEWFKTLISLQGGDVVYVEETDKLPRARYVERIQSDQEGYLAKLDAQVIGQTAVFLGAGRLKKGDAIDYAVGIVCHEKIGNFIKRNQPLFTVHANDQQRLIEARRLLLSACSWSEDKVNALPLIYEEIV